MWQIFYQEFGFCSFYRNPKEARDSSQAHNRKGIKKGDRNLRIKLKKEFVEVKKGVDL
jgi:hypothetical protein